MKTKLNVWISPHLRAVISARIQNFLLMNEDDFEEVSKPELAHVAIINNVKELDDSPHLISPQTLCLSIIGSTQPEDSRVIRIYPNEFGMNLISAIRAIRRHEEIVGVPT